MTLSPVDPLSPLPDHTYTWGNYQGEVSRDILNFTQEIKAVYFIPNVSPDFEGIVFYLEDGTFHRIGLD